MDDFSVICTPIGHLRIECEQAFITKISFTNEAIKESNNTLLKQTKLQLEEYFEGKRKVFDLPLYLKGTTFQKQVWNALRTIPYGKTCSYSQIASKINKPLAVRAVGMANHKNPIVIVIPCHRVIGKDGSLTGYAGGLEVKEKLLALEKDMESHWYESKKENT